jgi:hypothetical protein
MTAFLHSLKADFLDPVQTFELFFTSEILDLMTEHTNAYAESKDANSGDAAWKLPGRIWRDISKLELKQWIGILICEVREVLFLLKVLNFNSSIYVLPITT